MLESYLSYDCNCVYLSLFRKCFLETVVLFCFILFCFVLRVFWVRKMVYANMELLVEGRKIKTMQVPFIKAVLI